MRRLIVTADDFGLSPEVNEAVERGHREGILSAASLMVAAPASADAIRRAHRWPSLRVGLHVVLVNGRPVLPASQVPDLVNERGEFESRLFAAGVRYFFTPGIRKQLEAEIRAQFEAFARAGLPLDHVNAQNHFHVHPTVLSIVMSVGRKFGARAIRTPYEPSADAADRLFLAPWLALMRARLRAGGFITNDYIFGMRHSGHMTAARVLAVLESLPQGVSELYLHPATRAWPGAFPPDYDFAGEFAALIDPAVIESIQSNGIRRITFTELADAR